MTNEERLEKITNACLERLEKQLGQTTGISDAVVVKEVGEALKALADGLDSYKKATKGHYKPG